MSDIRIAQSWDSIPPVLYDGDEAISTRKLERDYRQAADRIEALEAALKEAVKWNWISDTQDIPDYVVAEIEAALNKGKDQ